jgi:hypothetical protein
MILAKVATEIAADRGNGIGVRRWINVKKRLLFNRINVLGNQRPKNQRVQNTILIFSDTAQATPTGVDFTPVSA